MRLLDDTELLSAYATQRSEEAFATLVERHVSLVYSSALRQVRDPHLAGEITQAVFIILARKAGSLGRGTILPGWLCRTAHYAACNALKCERRRQHWQQEAHMNSILTASEPDPWPGVAPLLDEAVAQLGEADRNAVVLRYYQQKPLEEVGRALGLNADAAQKRVSRALDKLRKFFRKRGVDSTPDAIARTISANSIQAAPLALAKSVTAAALAKSAVSGGSTLALVKATLITMKTKTIVATTAAIVIVAGISAWLAGLHFGQHPDAASSPANSGVVVPVKFANDAFADPASNPRLVLQTGGGVNNGDWFLNEVDPNTRRTTNSAPAGHLKSLQEINVSDSATWYLTVVMGSDHRQVVRYLVYPVAAGSPLLGKRVRVSGWVKVNGVRNWAGGTLIVANQDHGFTFDDTTSRPISGTADWQPLEFVTDLPKEPCVVYLAEKLYGNGEAWFDDFQLDTVPANTPITDDRDWRFFGASPADYSETTDFKVTHNGHPSLCIAYLPEGTTPPAAKMYWGKGIRFPESDKYKGHTARLTVWIKSENISDGVFPAFHPRDANGKVIAREQGNQRIRGTTDWTQRIITCRFPEETDGINVGFNFSGSGKFWIDTSSIKYEIVK